MSRKAAAILACVAWFGIASAKAEELQARIYQTKSLDRERANDVLPLVQQLMGGKVVLGFTPSLHTVLIKPNAGNVTAADLDRAEALLARYDVPLPMPAQVQFTAYLVRASMKPDPQATAIPPVLDATIKEMQSTFPYTNYSLVDIAITNVRGGAKTDSLLPGNDNPPYFYSIHYPEAMVSSDGKTIVTPDLSFQVRVPVVGNSNSAITYQNTGITTTVTIREGQKLVLGKIRLLASDLFLVLTAKIL